MEFPTFRKSKERASCVLGWLCSAYRKAQANRFGRTKPARFIAIHAMPAL
jgi:hypothetical protein